MATATSETNWVDTEAVATKHSLDTEEFKRGLERLEKIAQQNKVAIVCAERFPWRCHRRFISLELEKHGWKVVHPSEAD